MPPWEGISTNTFAAKPEVHLRLPKARRVGWRGVTCLQWRGTRPCVDEPQEHGAPRTTALRCHVAGTKPRSAAEGGRAPFLIASFSLFNKEKSLPSRSYHPVSRASLPTDA